MPEIRYVRNSCCQGLTLTYPWYWRNWWFRFLSSTVLVEIMFCIFGLFVYCYFIFQKDGTEIQAFVAECQGQIVGLSVIRREEVMIYRNNSICIFLFYINLLCQYTISIIGIQIVSLFSFNVPFWQYDYSWTIFFHSSEHRIHPLPLQHRGLYLLQSPQARGPWPPPSLCLEPHL